VSTGTEKNTSGSHSITDNSIKHTFHKINRPVAGMSFIRLDSPAGYSFVDVQLE
jgi:hypothetical protein